MKVLIFKNIKLINSVKMTNVLIDPVPSDANDGILTSDLVDFDGHYGLHLKKETVGIDAIWNMLY